MEAPSEIVNWQWAIGTAIDAVAILVAAIIVAWQVREQFRLNRKLQKDEYRDKLFLEIFREIDELSIVAQKTNVTAEGYVQDILTNLEMALDPKLSQAQPSFYNLRITNFQKNDQALNNAVIALIFKLESMEISHKNLYVFRLAIHSAHYDKMMAFSKLFSAYLGTIPADVPEQMREDGAAKVFVPPMPTDATLQKIRPLTKAYKSPCEDISCYLFDLRVELQNLLLGSLFDHRVPKRVPIDPHFKVISLGPTSYVKELEEYFETQSEWGKSNIAASARAKANLVAKGLSRL